MTFAAADPVPSGRRHPVLQIAGLRPVAIADFVGTNLAVTIDCAGRQQVVTGDGSRYGDYVRFHQKDAAGGKDVRVWRIADNPAGEGFTAEAVTAGQA